MKWITKHNLKLAKSCSGEWEPTRAKRSDLDFWKVSKEDLQKCTLRSR